MTPSREIQNLMGGKSITGEREATSSNINQVEKANVFSKVEKVSWEDFPEDVVFRICDCDLTIDPQASLGWSQNDISIFLFRGELPTGLTKESLIKLIRSARIK